MQLGKTDGKHLCFSLSWCAFSFFIPQSKWTFAVSGGAGLFVVGVNAPRPFVSLFRLGDRPNTIFARMWHLRAPYNIVRIGSL